MLNDAGNYLICLTWSKDVSTSVAWFNQAEATPTGSNEGPEWMIKQVKSGVASGWF